MRRLSPVAALPVLAWLMAYQRPWLRLDVIAGMTTAAVVIPKAMAYATIAGLPLQIGLYTALTPMVVYALLGTSRPLSVSTTTTLAILTASQLAIAVPNGDPVALLTASVTLSLLVGCVLMLAALFRLGFSANFISESVLVGFKAGIGIVIIVDQLPKLLGVHFHKGSFLHNLEALFHALPATSLPTLLMAVAVIALLILLEKLRPQWPAPLFAVGVSIAAAAYLAVPDYGIELVGAIPTGLPALTMPDLALVEILWPGAVGIALMSFVETAAAGRAFCGPNEATPKPNVELLATGAANMAGSLLGAMPAGGGTSQTAVNRRAGARTQLAALVCALMTLLVMVALAPLIAYLPQATLAAVVIVYSVELVSWVDFRRIVAIRHTEFIWAVCALLGVILLGTLQGILIAIIFSIIALGSQQANPPVNLLARIPGTNGFRPVSKANPDDIRYPGLMMVRPEGRLFFLNAEVVADKIRTMKQQEKPRVMLLDLRGVFDLEYSALKMLVAAEERQREQGVLMLFAAPNQAVHEVLMRSPLGAQLNDERLFESMEQAVNYYQRHFMGGVQA